MIQAVYFHTPLKKDKFEMIKMADFSDGYNNVFKIDGNTFFRILILILKKIFLAFQTLVFKTVT